MGEFNRESLVTQTAEEQDSLWERAKVWWKDLNTVDEGNMRQLEPAPNLSQPWKKWEETPIVQGWNILQIILLLTMVFLFFYLRNMARGD